MLRKYSCVAFKASRSSCRRLRSAACLAIMSVLSSGPNIILDISAPAAGATKANSKKISIFVWRVNLPKAKLCNWVVELAEVFFEAFARTAQANLHVRDSRRILPESSALRGQSFPDRPCSDKRLLRHDRQHNVQSPQFLWLKECLCAKY